MTRVFNVIRSTVRLQYCCQSLTDKAEISFYCLSSRPDLQRHQDNCFCCSNCGCLICYNQCEFHDSFSIILFWQCWLWQWRLWHCHSVRKSCSCAVPPGMRNLRSDLSSSCLFRVLTGSLECRDTQPVKGQEPGNGRAEPSLATRACLVSA